MRFVTETAAAFAYGVYRTRGAVAAVEADAVRMKEVLDSGKDPIAAEPLYISLGLAGHPDAHEAARVLSRDARIQKKSLAQMMQESKELEPYWKKLTAAQIAVLEDPARYLGASIARTHALCDQWERTIMGWNA
jgi:adenylosuccinate lyase